MRALIHEFGGGDEAERFFDAIVLVVELHLTVTMCVATETEGRVIGVLVVVELAKIGTAVIGGVDGLIRQRVFTLEVSDI